MPTAAVVACSVVAAAIAGMGTYFLLTRMAEAHVRARARLLRVRFTTRSPFAKAEETRTDLITVPEPHVLDAEPAIDLRLAWHVARRAHGRHQAT